MTSIAPWSTARWVNPAAQAITRSPAMATATRTGRPGAGESRSHRISAPATAGRSAGPHSPSPSEHASSTRTPEAATRWRGCPPGTTKVVRSVSCRATSAATAPATSPTDADAGTGSSTRKTPCGWSGIELVHV